MADLGANLRTKLLADATLRSLVGDRIHVNKIPARPGNNFIYLAVDSTQENETLDGQVGEAPLSQTYAAECISLEGQAEAIAIKQRLRQLNNFRGTLGDQTVKGIFVNEFQEQYEPRGVGDTGAHVAVCQVQVFI